MNDKLSRQNCVLYVCGIVPVVWLALLAAPLLEGGLGTLLEGFGTALENPFHIVWCDKSLKTLLIFLMLYGLGISIYVSNERVYRRREEQGSARWGNPLSIAKRYQQSGNANKLLTQQMALGLDGRKHRRNLNVLICGGSGAGKTRYYAKPNIMQANTSFVILDPKGELLRDTGHLLEEKGYVIKVLDLINPERSHCYNPFVYLRDDDDIQRLATNIMKNTTPKDSKSSDHFWEDMAAMLLKALISYLHYEAPPEEQNFPMVMDMIRAGDVKEDNEEYVSTLDDIVQGVISTIMQAAGFGQPQSAVLPSEIVSAIEDCGFFESIPLWAVTLIGGLFIWVLSFQMILSVYGRFFKMFMYTAIAPIPLSTFAGEPTQSIGKSFLKSYASVCLEGAVIVLACVIFSAFASSPPVVDAGAAAASMVWSYIGELIFNMLILVGSVKMADRVVREMMGL